MALALFGLAVLTRLPFATTNLYAPDSVLYARGMELFDPFDQRPQPPGYLWYVLVLRAIDLLTHDPNRAMTIVSALAEPLDLSRSPRRTGQRPRALSRASPPAHSGGSRRRS